MTVVSIYQYKGFIFEFRFCALKLNKDLTPAAAMGRKFWKAFDEWSKLTKEEKAETLIFGQP